MKRIKKDPLSEFIKLTESKPVRPGTFRVALENNTLTSSYWDGERFEMEVVAWAERKVKR